MNIGGVGHKNFERWPPIAWRRSAETVGQMRAARWQVFAYCRTCHLTVTVDVRMIELARGANFSLWNRQAKCRRAAGARLSSRASRQRRTFRSRCAPNGRFPEVA